MKTLKEKFGQFALTREQMKMVKGGVWFSCRCIDGGNAGAWEGNYGTSTQINTATSNYCSSNRSQCDEM